MIQTCPLCGKMVEGAVSQCPRCGEPLTAHSGSEVQDQGGLAFPQRRTPSHEDERAAARRKGFERGSKGSVWVANPSWEEIFRERPFDIPLFTAQGDEACIGVFFSQGFMSRGQILDEILQQRRTFALQFATFPGERYPILRSNLLVPDNPRNPLVLEAPLDILSGDIQDFCKAVVARERVAIAMAHEEKGEASSSGALYGAPGLAALLSREVRRAIELIEPSASRVDFEAAVEEMERVFPAAYQGLDPKLLVRLTFVERL